MSALVATSPIIIESPSIETATRTEPVRQSAEPRKPGASRRRSRLTTLRDWFHWRDAFTPTSAW